MLSTFFILIIFTLGATERKVRYVLPNASSAQDCPTQPCCSLDQYIKEYIRCFTSDSTFIFLPGNHTLSIPLNITAITNMTFRGAKKDVYSNIKCANTLTLNNITNFHIEGLMFVLNLTQQEGKLSSSALVFIYNDEVVITNIIFYTFSNRKAIVSVNSNITITNCLFDGFDTGINGGALFVTQKTVLILTGNNFTSNHASRGGAIYAEESAISLRENLIKNNSGYDTGGAIIILFPVHN